MSLRPIRVLVIDDSAFSRRAIARALEGSPLIEVVGTARDGDEALRKVLELAPDVVTLDLEMPRMDGFTFLRLLMSRRPTPVIVVSARAGDEAVFRSLELGAVDFVAKPTARATPELEGITQEILRKVHGVRELRLEKLQERIAAPAAPTAAPLPPGDAGAGFPRVVALGASTGGPSALLALFGAFPEPPRCSFLVSQHMPRGFTRGFAERIDRLTALRAREATDGATLEPGGVLVAPGGCHLELESVGGRIVACLRPRQPADKYAPSVDRMFGSAAKHFGPDLLAVVLTGMGDDGRVGVAAVKARGGRVIVESEQTAVIYGMPKQALRTGSVDAVLPLGEIPAAIQRGRLPARGRPPA